MGEDRSGPTLCEHCGRDVPRRSTVGRPRRYCRRSCRQRAYEQRRRLGDRDWAETRVRELAATIAELEDEQDRLGDALDELAATVEDRVLDGDLKELLLGKVDGVRRAGAVQGAAVGGVRDTLSDPLPGPTGEPPERT